MPEQSIAVKLENAKIISFDCEYSMVGRSLYVTVVAVVALQEGPNIENSSGVHITEMLAVDCV